ncbi:2-oxo acid dehydrogenase subunit E2 [Sphingobium sp. JS3065]|uniref:2-oxo acid dehydrogenase subunit E2 n=1 Tax=Sphingobium sp. JS3065 TaxID=2970925 RepID=UPI002264580F|nr:2-oxo acid dehydrogenase subunit E2 [Sphingobium sp. JS3065]UZW57077.1 2-oxo acid dehydrogenase subunit E2 [Sphingobium sp. JS3065]
MSDIPTLISSLAPWPDVDFSEFGEVKAEKLPRMQALTGKFLGRNWVTIPHVTYHDDVDVTDVEHRRKSWNAAHPDSKLTPVAILAKVLAQALAEFPQFNVSINTQNQTLIRKSYYHVGIAVDTPAGLVVPVIRDVDRKSLSEIADELKALADKARTKGLNMQEMSGSCISLSSLGHIGGTSFTPIVNAPDVAILGVTRTRPVPARGPDGELMWRDMMPLSLSYDHRAINGADAAYFVRYIGMRLADPTLLDGG